MSLFSIVLFSVFVLAPAVGGILLIVLSRKKGTGFPSCGKCGYNVAGTLGTSNARCPECGSDFSAVGIIPSETRRSVPMLVSGIVLLVIPVLCVGMSALTMFPAMSAARQRAQATVAAAQAQAQAAQAQAAQTQAMQTLAVENMLIAETLRLSAETHLMRAVAPALLETCRTRIADIPEDRIAARIDALWQELQDTGSADPENARQLHAEMIALFERLLPPDAPANVRDHLANPITMDIAESMSEPQLREALAVLTLMRTQYSVHQALAARLQIEFNNLMAALRTVRNASSVDPQPSP